MHEAAQAPHSLDHIKQDADLHGLTAALESLTASVEERFRGELAKFERKWAAIEDVKSTEELFATRCAEFLEKLSHIRKRRTQAVEIITALHHPSFQAEFSRILRRAGLSGNVRYLPSPTAGKVLVDLVLSLHLMESKWVDNKSVGAFAKASSYLGSYALTERFWVDEGLGTPLVGRGFTDEKGLLDKAYKKLVHAIFLYEGYFEAKEFILRSLQPDRFLEVFSDEIEFGDAKTLLQEYMQDLGLKPPAYHYSRDPNSPDHDPIFQVSLELPNIGRIIVDAKSKKEGSKKLSELAIIELKRHKQSRISLMRLLSKKSTDGGKEMLPVSTQSIPQEVFDLAQHINAETGLNPDYFRLTQALKTKSVGLSQFNRIPDNDTISRIGALVLEFAIISSDPKFRSLGVEGIHPRICDRICDRFALGKLSRVIFKPVHDWGVNTERQMAQAVLFALFIEEQRKFFDKFQAWLQVQDVFAETLSRSGGDRLVPESFDEKFSYVTVLQELVQKSSPLLPKYSKMTSGPTHAAAHTAICEYSGNSTKGSSSRFVWAKNEAAYHMLVKLGFWRAQSE